MLTALAKNLQSDDDVLLDPDTEALLQESRDRLARPLTTRERRVEWAVAGAFLVAAGAMALLLGDQRELSLPIAATLLVAYAISTRVRFEVGPSHTAPVELVLVPMLFLLPVAAVPLIAVLGHLLGEAPDYLRGRRHPERAVLTIADYWYTLGPALVFSAAGSPAPDLADWPLYLGALASQFAIDIAVTTPREWRELGLRPRAQLASAVWTFGVDALLFPIGLLAAIGSVQHEYGFLLVLPLIVLIAIFAGERRARLDVALQLSDAYRGTMMALADVLETDDKYTGSHSRMVVSLAQRSAEHLGLLAQQRRLVEFGALLHDIGKIAIPKEVLNKPGPLSAEEWELIKLHTVRGQVMLERAGGMLRSVGRVVRSSHERWDGGGYPDGLRGEEIPIESRVVSCCDAFSAMTTDRPYRQAMSNQAAIAELQLNAGSQFDPGVVDALVAVVSEFAEELVIPLEAEAARASRALEAPT